jgi:hypothetical protein
VTGTGVIALLEDKLAGDETSSPLEVFRPALAAISVSVRVRHYFTIININGVEIYFYRFTDKRDGTGFSLVSGCKPGAALEQALLDAEPAAIPALSQTES